MRKSKRNWKSSIVENGIKFTLLDTDPDQKNNVTFEIVYSMDAYKSSITAEYRAITSNKPTHIAFPQQPCLNLNGVGSNMTDVANHEIKINADYYIGTEKSAVPHTDQVFHDGDLSYLLGSNVNWMVDKLFLINQQAGKKYVAR
jgi:hypothetical protein